MQYIVAIYMYSLIILTVLHAVLVLFQAITLNVAINSHNKVLMVVMVSNQVRISLTLIVNRYSSAA